MASMTLGPLTAILFCDLDELLTSSSDGRLFRGHGRNWPAKILVLLGRVDTVFLENYANEANGRSQLLLEYARWRVKRLDWRASVLFEGDRVDCRSPATEQKNMTNCPRIHIADKRDTFRSADRRAHAKVFEPSAKLNGLTRPRRGWCVHYQSSRQTSKTHAKTIDNRLPNFQQI